jgi:predicted transcriptional regulator of viral defense system
VAFLIIKDMPTIKVPKNDITKYFDRLPQKVFMKNGINHILTSMRKSWELPESMTVNKFIVELIKKQLIEVEIKSSNYDTTYSRYVWGTGDYKYQISLSLRAHSYLSHQTAMFLHGLMDRKSKTIYVNAEQSPKPSVENSLEQNRIDAAFKRKPRTTKFIFKYKTNKIFCLNGINTKNMGVINLNFPGEGFLSVTNMERTLIDIAVRPIYSGGCKSVLEAYKRAKGNISVEKLTDMLKKIRYVSYHQAIGLYMQKAGFNEKDMAMLKKFGMKYDFYLDYEMKNPGYSKEWKIYYPKNL